jgi:acyl dehydratase
VDRIAPYEVVARNIDPQADNRIHDDDVARRFGFQGALVPGVELFAYVSSPLGAAWGEEWLAGGSLALRFRRPVYDGERVTVQIEPGEDGAYAVSLVGPDGTARSTGTASRGAAGWVDLSRYAEHPLPEVLRAPEPAAIPDGPFGTVTEPGSQQALAAYCEAVTEPLPLYRDGVLHPGLLLRLVNRALMRNVALGPWVHTASSCRWLAVARVPAELSVRSTVTGRSERKGHKYVHYDALVLADGRPVAEVAHEAIYSLAG